MKNLPKQVNLYFYRDGISRAFYAFSTCLECHETRLNYFPDGLRQFRYNEPATTECGLCGNRSAAFSTPLLGTSN